MAIEVGDIRVFPIGLYRDGSIWRTLVAVAQLRKRIRKQRRNGIHRFGLHKRLYSISDQTMTRSIPRLGASQLMQLKAACGSLA
jgi:hypothetical protein